MNAIELTNYLKRYSFNRCARWVACTFLGFGLDRQAQEHLARNVGQPSERATKLLAFLRKVGVEGAAQRIAFFDEQEEISHDVEWSELAALKLCNTPGYELELSAIEHAGSEWWYEEQLEESGDTNFSSMQRNALPTRAANLLPATIGMKILANNVLTICPGMLNLVRNKKLQPTGRFPEVTETQTKL